MTREELAEAANYSPDTVKSMEQGVRMPTPRVLDVVRACPDREPASAS
ncbi:helix-turn-helix transcriptional regulator [Streptomyces sp. ND04-05B]|nr:helix-turn-helix transcriptional regulator [Streptomyces sp. ND04-05B]MDX3069378.1 helix-turn-helix transcriptional regulator [Streptomyces sp. ND04-05B]